MTKAQALTLARAKWGKGAIVRHNRHGGNATTRAIAHNERDEHRANKPEPVTREWKTRDDRLLSAAISYCYEIGYTFETPFGTGIGVRGTGDSWEEACRAADLL